MRVTIAGLEVAWGERRVLRGIDAEFIDPQRVAIVGPSGAGKSTLMAVIAGQLRPSRGSVEVIVPADRDPRPEWIVQASPLLLRRTALENVMLGPLSRGMSVLRAEVVARRIMVDLGLGALPHTPAYQLSGGERQRVAVSRAVAAGPLLVLADEPTASLDSISKRSVITALEGVSRYGALLIVATHDMDVADMCDRRLRLVDGVLLEDGPRG